MKSIIFSALFFLAGASNIYAQIGNEFETDSITTATLVATSFISDNVGWIADTEGVLRKTSDGSETYSQIATGIFFTKLDFINETTGYGLTFNAAYKTTNGGSTWNALALPGEVGDALYFFDVNKGFISGSGLIYKTANGGSTWSTIEIAEGISFREYYFISASTGVAAANDEKGHQSKWRTTDSGAHWINVYNERNYFINSVWFTSATTGWAAGYYNKMGWGMLPVINKTIDGGLTWQNIYINDYPGPTQGEEFLDIQFKNESEGFAISTFMESVFTTDGGLTWHFTYDDEGEAMNSKWGIYKALDGASELYLIGSNGYVTKWK